ncbi:MAG TPA: hypothetical protein VKQ07_04570 [Jatrophihabitantaceae bacterium]|nr:hypothetical protein [Jatrophihabitantaceae bacterium]
MSSTQSVEHHAVSTASRTSPREAWTGIAFPVLFLASVAVSNPPADNASNAKWIANYTGSSEQARHLATGVLLVLAGLCLASFLTALWRRIRDITPSISPLPLVASAASASCIAAGGVVMAFVSGGELFGKYPLPSADVLRLSNDLGFALVAVAGMLAAALAVVCLSVQGNAAGVFGRRTRIFGIVVSVVLLAGVAFAPVFALLIWTTLMAIRLLRRPN